MTLTRLGADAPTGPHYVSTLAQFEDGLLRSRIADAITTQPRSQQKRIGPSEIGTPCDACLVSKLAGQSPEPEHLPWLPAIGTAVHAWLEDVFSGDESEYLTEKRVTVGSIGDTLITGSADLFHVPTGTVIDWKAVGNTTLTDAAKKGDKAVYRVQKALYALGFEREGYDVRRCVVAYLPRNHLFLDRAVLVVDEFDDALRMEAEVALARANQWHARIQRDGVTAALEAAGEHTGKEFSCKDHAAAAKLRVIG